MKQIVSNKSQQFIRVSSGAPWESKVGYCRAVRAGSDPGAVIAVSGTVAAGADAYAQAKAALAIIEAALQRLGADRTRVIRTRLFVRDISRWEEIGRAHAEFFGEHCPATSMVEVKALISPDYLLEIEADAVSAD
ncbi:MAG: hypothetical protein IT285_15865 [Bdellovibrionales bacterium]|nr:hypothetical protein [Bdellovibrionales bacterium]